MDPPPTSTPVNLLAHHVTAAGEHPIFKVEKYALANGLQVWIHYKPTSTIARADLIVNVGSRHESLDINGISHLIEHMTFTGTAKWDETQVQKTIDQLGGRWNAWTSQESTNYYTTVPASDLETALEWLCEVVFKTTLPEDKLDRERDIVFQEKGGQYDWAWDQAERLGLGYNLTEKLEHQMFSRSSLDLSVIGRDRALNQMDRQDLVDYHAQHYLPNNAVLVVAGNTPSERVLTAAQKFFGDLAPGELPPRPETPEVKPHPQSSVVVRGTSVSEQVRLKLTAPTVCQGHPDYWALEVISEVLDHKLHDELRLHYGLVYSSGAWNEVYSDTGYFCISTRVHRKNTDKALKIIQAALESLQEVGLNEPAISEAKKSLVGRWSLSMDSAEHRAAWVVAWVGVLAPDQPLPNYPEKIAAVTLAELQRVAKTYLQPSHFHTGMHQPIVTVTSAVRWLGILLGLGALGFLGWYGSGPWPLP
ncbi:MAG: pitrilysin family protein [Cyanobacteria bacterium]|nr:pitrilysin family protein [Cyanobacteriota bacterium]